MDVAFWADTITQLTSTQLNSQLADLYKQFNMLCEISEQYGFTALWAAMTVLGALSVRNTSNSFHSVISFLSLCVGFLLST